MTKIIVFSASWCAPCIQQHPILQALSVKHDIPITFYDVEQDYDHAVRYGITSVPVIIKLNNEGFELERIEGARPKYELEKFIVG